MAVRSPYRPHQRFRVFDTEAGKQELTLRRIGDNELQALKYKYIRAGAVLNGICRR